MMFPVRRVALLILVFFVALYVLTAQGSIQSLDGQIMYELTESLAERGSVAISNPAGVEGIDGRLYSKYGIGQSIAVIPLYLIGKVILLFFNPGFGGTYVTKFMTSMFNPIVTALTCLLLFLFGLKLDYSVRTSLALSFVYGLGTMAWPYSQTFFSEPFTALMLLLSFYAVLSYRKTGAIVSCRGEGRWLLWAGLSLAIAVLTRMAALIAVPILALYVLLISKEKGWSRAFKNLARVLSPLIPVFVFLGFYNAYRFGNPLQAGYGMESFTNPLFVGLYGFLFSSGKSVFLYNPILILSVVSLIYFYRKYRDEAIGFSLMALIYVIFYAMWAGWDAWWWGPRYLLVVIPFLVLPLGVFLEGNWAISLKRVLAVLLALGFIVQIYALPVTYARYLYEMYIRYPENHMQKIEFEPRYSPLVGQARSISAVIGNMGRKDFLRTLAQEQRFQGLMEENGGKEYFLKHALALNCPNFWLFYLYYSGFPSSLILLALVILLSSVSFSGYLLLKLTGETAKKYH
ncbi:MAG: hypothetical protein QMD08_06970 [Actinomycetota bacterium]|nr:hypothetical protein [Actinomycetota bacterium]